MAARSLVDDIGLWETGILKHLQEVGVVLVDVDDNAVVLDLQLIAGRAAILEPHLDIADLGSLGLLSGLVQECGQVFACDIDCEAGTNPRA